MKIIRTFHSVIYSLFHFAVPRYTRYTIYRKYARNYFFAFISLFHVGIAITSWAKIAPTTTPNLNLKNSFHTREFVVVSQCSFVSTTVKCAWEWGASYSREIKEKIARTFSTLWIDVVKEKWHKKFIYTEFACRSHKWAKLFWNCLKILFAYEMIH
jgi:hypothetical protein